MRGKQTPESETVRKGRTGPSHERHLPHVTDFERVACHGRARNDDGHHGADFAYWTRGERTTMLGHPVLAVLGGTVAGVVQNRTPYGYAVIIETPLDALPPGWESLLPAPAPTSVTALPDWFPLLL